MENGPEKVRFFEENNMLKRNKHGAGAKFRGFPFFRKNRKIGAKMAPKVHENWSKIRSGADPGSIVSLLCGVLERGQKIMIC